MSKKNDIHQQTNTGQKVMPDDSYCMKCDSSDTIVTKSKQQQGIKIIRGQCNSCGHTTEFETFEIYGSGLPKHLWGDSSTNKE